jgi:putative copper resistance protein D
MIIVMIALLSQWARSDEKEARRSDRIGDRRNDEELDAYNRMLAGLAEQDGSRSAAVPHAAVSDADEPNRRDGPV